jgi:KaiC/GvpD/RAD55 family RecA-like ATPase
MRSKVPTGIIGLDSLLGGGFPDGGVILVTGNPGTGKTILSTQFLTHGATDHGERGIYVSFAENAKDLTDNASQFGVDLNTLEKKRLLKIIDSVSFTHEGMKEAIGDILDSVNAFHPQRLVFDPISAVLQGLGQAESRTFLHAVFSKIARHQGITTLLIGEVPYGNRNTGFGVEEFVVDGIINLGRSRDGFRTLEIRKMRATRVTQSRAFFTLSDGFQMLNPTAPLTPASRPTDWKPVQDSNTYFSSGSEQLDTVLGGGYPRGRYIVLEADANVPIDVVNLFVLPLAWNFLSQGRGVLFLPVLGADGEEIKELLTQYVQSDVFTSHVRVFEQAKEGKDQSAPYLIVGGKPEDPLERIEELLNNTSLQLRRDTGQPVLRIIGYPALEALYAGQNDLLLKEIGAGIAQNRSLGNLTLAVARPGLQITPRVLNIVDWHMQLIERKGCIFMRLVKPTPGRYFAVEEENVEACRGPKLTPMM